MSSKPAFAQSLRRLKPEQHLKQLRARNRSELTYLQNAKLPLPKLLLDTTVYIDVLQGRQPEHLSVALRAGSLWHSTVTEAELSVVAGLLSPTHADTQKVVDKVGTSIEMRPAQRILNPDREIWREAGILAGLLARLQAYGKNEQRRALNDALIFLTGVKHGCAVLTRNFLDFDLLLQLDLRGQVIFYDHLPANARPGDTKS